MDDEVIVPIPVYRGAKLTDYQQFWGLGVGRLSDGRRVWGLTYADSFTHMRYAVDDAPPAEALARIEEFGWWYFDAGRELRVTLADLEAGFRALDLIPPPVPEPPPTGWHAGRAWAGTEVEDACPCEQEPCGLVNLTRASADCPEHRIAWAKTIRQWHPAAACPGRRP